jgi:HK97 family phage major capsid protein
MDGGLEVKAGPAPAQNIMQDWEEFKAANDERLAQIERRLAADVVTAEKVERLNRAMDAHKQALDEAALAPGRPRLDTGAAKPADGEHKTAWDAYMRKGDASVLARVEIKSLTGSFGPDGGYVVPPETESMIDRMLARVSPVRAIASVRQIGAAVFRKPVASGGASAGWVGETQARPETLTPPLSVIEFPAMELYAMPAATQSLLDDAYVDVERWLAEEVQTEFAEQEGQAFISGDGVNRPRGLTTYPFVADTSWSWGRIGYVATGAAGDFGPSSPADALVDLIYAPRQAYRANGKWLMNRNVQARIRKLKDGEGNYLWQPSAVAGEPATLLGYPVHEAEDMPDIAANSYSVMFGDFQKAYLIVDRAGVRVLRDPYSAKPYVLFYTSKRVGGGVQNFEAVKALKFAAS